MKVATTVAVLLLLAFGPGPAFADNGLARLDTAPGQVVFEVVGQVTNIAPDADHPLGSSIQYGYVAYANGIPGVFSTATPSDQNESTALLTFYTEVTTRRVNTNGPFTIIIREGTTTVYLNAAAATFSSPDSFRAGVAVQTSSIRQQVIVDGSEKTFTVLNLNVISSASSFDIAGQRYQLGAPGQMFRTTLQGVLFVRSGGTPPPTGHFAGYAIGVTGKNNESAQ